jgi:uncharacterized protein (TIGR03067 family)
MRLLALIAAGLLAGTLTAAPVPKSKPTVKDEEAIVGSWTVSQFDADGAFTPPAVIAAIRFTFGEKGKLGMGSGPGERPEGSFRLDPAAGVKTVDIVVGGKKLLGLYELDGDALKLCIPSAMDNPRPEEMKADRRYRVTLVTLRRVKDEPKKEK